MFPSAILLTSLSLLASSAKAEPAMDIACEPLYVTDTRPSIGQEGVALDARMVALMAGDCGAASTYTLTLAIANDGVETELQTEVIDGTAADNDNYVVLNPEQELEPGRSYVFRITPGDGWGEVTEVGFVAGAEYVNGNGEVPPTLEVQSAELYDDGDGSFSLSWYARAEVVSDDDKLALLAVLDPNDSESFSAIGAPDSSGIADFWGYEYLEEDPGEWCMQAVRIDGAGGWSLPSEESCLETNFNGGEGKIFSWGCSSAPASASLTGLLLAMTALRRRR